MTKTSLAKCLRARQLTKGLVSPELLEAISDDALILSYVTCSCCGNVQVTTTQLRGVIERATDDENFLAICDSYGPLHRAAPARA